MDTAEKKTRVEDAYLRIKEEILLNRLPPGLQMTELEFAIQFGMSRTPIREALVMLQIDGLLELIPRKGARILPISSEDMREIYEILTTLEPEAAAGLAEKSDGDLPLIELEHANIQMEKALKENDLDAWAKADDRFHRKLLKLHGNKRLYDFVNTLLDQVHRARIVTLKIRKIPVQSTMEHRLILNHIMHGNQDEARKVFIEHRKRAARELLGILEKLQLKQL